MPYAKRLIPAMSRPTLEGRSSLPVAPAMTHFGRAPAMTNSGRAPAMTHFGHAPQPHVRCAATHWTQRERLLLVEGSIQRQWLP